MNALRLRLVSFFFLACCALPTRTVAVAQAGASATPAVAEGTATTALLRVYRARRFVGSGLAPSIFVDDKEVVRIGNGRRATIKLTPGAHTVRSDDKSSAIALDAKSGQEYYVRVDEEPGAWKGHGKLTLLMPEQGSAEYKLQKPAEENRQIAKDMLAEDAEASSDQKK